MKQQLEEAGGAQGGPPRGEQSVTYKTGEDRT